MDSPQRSTRTAPSKQPALPVPKSSRHDWIDKLQESAQQIERQTVGELIRKHPGLALFLLLLVIMGFVSLLKKLF